MVQKCVLASSQGLHAVSSNGGYVDLGLFAWSDLWKVGTERTPKGIEGKAR